jgi:hypothetical protein
MSGGFMKTEEPAIQAATCVIRGTNAKKGRSRAVHHESAGRQFGVVNVQPEYAAAGSGLEAALQAR